jgi:ABC-type lipoprotein release transport system permease subunit
MGVLREGLQRVRSFFQKPQRDTELDAEVAVASLLFGTPATDRATFLSMILLLLMVALLAGYIPARRASRINPMIALRNS